MFLLYGHGAVYSKQVRAEEMDGQRLDSPVVRKQQATRGNNPNEAPNSFDLKRLEIINEEKQQKHNSSEKRRRALWRHERTK